MVVPTSDGSPDEEARTAPESIGPRGARHGIYHGATVASVRDDFRQLLRVGMTFNTPMSAARAQALVERLAPAAAGATVLDLGCGWGELLLRIVAAAPGAVGRGLDLDAPSLARGRRLAAARGLAERVSFVEQDVTRTVAQGRVVVNIGASWAWGPAAAALAALHRAVEPGGLLLYGDAFWREPPSPAAEAIFGALPTFDELDATVRAAGFAVEQVERADLDEWDAFQAASLVGLAFSPDPEARAFAEVRRTEYATWRAALGFAYFVARA